MFNLSIYSKTCLKRPISKRPKIGFQYQLLLNAGQKYCRMLQGEHSAILSTFIKLPFVIKIFVLSIFEWPLKTGFNVIYTDWNDNDCMFCSEHNSYALLTKGLENLNPLTHLL